MIFLVPRSRNSIAVSSVEHLKNGNKRPHSIISVSSSSSSNSSHSSGFGAMTIPGLEPMPEGSIMPGARTSLTLCSNGKNTALLLYSNCVSMKHELNTTRDMASKYIVVGNNLNLAFCMLISISHLFLQRVE